MSATPATAVAPQGLAQWAFAQAMAIAAAPTLADLHALMRSATSVLGFAEYYFVEDTGRGPRVILGSASAPQIRERYAVEGGAPMSDDIIHRTARQTTDAFFYSDILTGEDASAADHANMARRKATGIGEGYVGIRHRQQNGVATSAVLLAYGPLPRTPDLRLAAGLIAEAFGAAARRLDARAPQAPPTLTDRQRLCLLWAARGKSDADIAAIVGLSAHTVHAHLAEVCERMGVRTRIQAVAMGVALGLIKP